MRTLLDLLNDERGYVRIYEEQDGFGYELSTYVQPPMADLFERMNGYASIAAAREAARDQLSAATQVRRLGTKRVRRIGTAKRIAESTGQRSSFSSRKSTTICITRGDQNCQPWLPSSTL